MSPCASLFMCTTVFSGYANQHLQTSGIMFQRSRIHLVTRSIGASQLNNTMWFIGPSFLYEMPQAQQHEVFELVNPETLGNKLFYSRPFSDRFQRFSTWESLLRAHSFLIHQACSQCHIQCKGWHQCSEICTPEEQSAVKKIIILHNQKDLYPQDYAALQKDEQVSCSSALWKLNTYVWEI